jgi:hypothetical protein
MRLQFVMAERRDSLFADVQQNQLETIIWCAVALVVACLASLPFG